MHSSPSDYASLLQFDYLIAQSFYSCAVVLNQDDCFALFLEFFYHAFNLPAVFRAYPRKRLIKQDQFIVPDHYPSEFKQPLLAPAQGCGLFILFFKQGHFLQNPLSLVFSLPVGCNKQILKHSHVFENSPDLEYSPDAKPCNPVCRKFINALPPEIYFPPVRSDHFCN